MIDTESLRAVVDSIRRNLNMLELSSNDTAYDDLQYYLPRIRIGLRKIKRLTESKSPEAGGDKNESKTNNI